MTASPEGTHLEPPCNGAGGFCTKCGEYVAFAPAPLFTPEEIEAWRVVRGYMEEFGFKDDGGRKNSPWRACDILDALFAEKMSAPSEKP